MSSIVPVEEPSRDRSDEGPDELRALARLGFEEIARVPGGIAQMHYAISRRAFAGVERGVGVAAKPVRLVHDSLAAGVYGALHRGAGLAGEAADRAIERRRLGEGRVLSATPGGSAVLAAINGLIGDTLERERSALVQPMAVRVDGRAVALEPDAVRAAFPQATPWPVLFLHGLMETEFSWRLGAGPGGETYGTRLARDLGCTPVYVRYNTGRHVSENGRDLADLVEELAAVWPVEIEQIALVGHSMGGSSPAAPATWGTRRATTGRGRCAT